MSEENVETVKEFTRLFEKGNRDSWREYFDPDVVWDTSASNWPSAGVLHGHAGVEQFFRDWLGTWSDFELATTEYLDAGDSVVIVMWTPFRGISWARPPGRGPAAWFDD